MKKQICNVIKYIIVVGFIIFAFTWPFARCTEITLTNVYTYIYKYICKYIRKLTRSLTRPLSILIFGSSVTKCLPGAHCSTHIHLLL